MEKSVFEKEEVRCDYFISSSMKKVWNVQLNILQEIIKICEKYNFGYSLYAGSMLGAARHKGFIPWDDDLDVCMLRKDYDRFLEVARKELPQNLFLQTAMTDTLWPATFAKIRDNNTTVIEETKVKHRLSKNYGIYVDIFPLDYIYGDEKRRLEVYSKYRKKLEILRTSRKIFKKHFLWQNSSCNIVHKILRFFYVYFYNTFVVMKKNICKFIVLVNGGYFKYYEKIENVFRNLPVNECDSICDCTFCAQVNPLARVYKKEWFDNDGYINVPFEYLCVKIPLCYDKILTAKFGDWHTMVRNGAFHSGEVFYPDVPFKKILKEKYGYMCEDFV